MKLHRVISIELLVGVLLLARGLPAENALPSTAPSTQPAPATQPATGTIKGRISMNGGLSLAKPDLTRVVVYLESDPTLDATPHVMDHATVEQRNRAFNPNFVVIPVGTVVEFPNWDNFDHNVFSRSKAAPAFDLDRYPRGQSKSRTFDKIGVVQVFCNIHPSMRAIIYVTPNIYYTRCDANGDFSIPDVPVGSYQLGIWNERCGESRQPVVVSTGDSPAIALTIAENRNDAIANNPRPNGGYGIERGLGVKREKLDLPVVKDSHAAIDAPGDSGK